MSRMAWLRAWEKPGVVRRLDAGVVAGDADGHGEGDPVWVDPGSAGRFGFEGAQGLVDGEEREEFLADQLRGSGSQDERCPAEPGLEFAVAVLDLPALVVGRPRPGPLVLAHGRAGW